MKHSLTFYLTILVLKLKGIKKNFSKDPIDYKKLRKEDLISPKEGFFKGKRLRKFDILKSKITEVNSHLSPSKVVLYIHGGAFISGPGKHHWDSLKKIVDASDCILWMCDYPKAPEHKIQEIAENVDRVYQSLIEAFPKGEIILVGDSVGGNLIISLTQRLIKKGLHLPSKLLLISPVMDSTMANPDIQEIELIDPMLSRKGVLSAKKMCAGTIDLRDALMSPIYGSFAGFPKTFLFIGERDITFPDQLLAVQKMEASNIDLSVIRGKNMPHIWPLLPVMKEARDALNLLIESIKD